MFDGDFFGDLCCFWGGGEGWGEVVSILLQLLEYLPFYVLVEKFHVS